MPLSLLYQHTWIRPLEEPGKADKRRQAAFEDKESFRWYEGMKQVSKLLDSSVHQLHIADREAGIYELFFHAFEPATDLLIRARQNRSLKADPHLLWDSSPWQLPSAWKYRIKPARKSVQQLWKSDTIP
jgi:hypothetical protein